MEFVHRKLYMYNLVFIILFLTLTTNVYSDDGVCHHCNSPAHMTEEEPCLLCGRLVKDCDYSHNVSLTYDKIINAPDSDALVDILFNIRKTYKNRSGKNLPLSEIFAKGNEFCNQSGVFIPEKDYIAVKDQMKRLDFHNRWYCHLDFDNDYSNSFASVEELYGIDCSAKSNYEKINAECEESMRYGILLIWCGAAVSVISDGILSTLGYSIAAIGMGWIGDSQLAKSSNEKQYIIEQAEEDRVRAAKEAKKAAKKEEKRRKKEEKKRLKNSLNRFI